MTEVQKTNIDGERPLTLPEAARYLSLGVTTLKRMIRKGEGPTAYRTGKLKFVFLRQDLLKWLTPDTEYRHWLSEA